jgi:hypothetical protein
MTNIVFALCVIGFSINPPPLAAGKSLRLNELWRIKPDSNNDLWFGRIGGVAVAPGGQIFVIDVQKPLIHVFDPGGHLNRSFGQGGEGPGDLPQRSDIFFSNEKLAVAGMVPASISYFTGSGDFVNRISIPTPDDAQLNFLFKCRQIDGGLVVEGEISKPRQPTETVRYLSLLDAKGKELTRFVEMPRTVNGKVQVHEATLNRFDNRWSAGGDRIYSSTVYSSYRIDVWASDGRQIQVIEKPYEHFERERIEQQALEANLGKNIPNSELDLSNYHRDVEAIHLVDTMYLLVLTSRGARTGRADSMGEFDVFSADGLQLGTVTLLGQGDPLHDRYIFSGKRLFVIVESLPHHYDCFQDSGRSIEPMTLICYEF